MHFSVGLGLSLVNWGIVLIICTASSKPCLDFRAQWASSINTCQLNKCPVVVCVRFGRQTEFIGGQLRKLGMTFQQQLCQRPSAFIKTPSAGKYIQYAQYKQAHWHVTHTCINAWRKLRCLTQHFLYSLPKFPNAFEFDQSNHLFLLCSLSF